MGDPEDKKKHSSSHVRAFRKSDYKKAVLSKTPPPEPATEEKTEDPEPRRAKSAPPKTKGLSLRWKIAGPGVLIIFVTALIIYMPVASRTSRLLDAEIDAKGMRLVETLAALDPNYWTSVLQQRNETSAGRRAQVTGFLEFCAYAHVRRQIRTSRDYEHYRATFTDEMLRNDIVNIVNQENDLRREKERVMQEYGERVSKNESLMRTLDELGSGIRIDETSQLDSFFVQAVGEEVYHEARDSKQFRDVLPKLVRRLDTADPFRPIKSEQGYKEIVQMSVLDVGSGRSISLSDKEMRVPPPTKDVDSVKIGEGQEVTTGLLVRSFIKEVNYKEGTLRFTVLLSLEAIQKVQGALISSILLPTFVAVALGMAVLVWISFFITNPLKMLMKDIDKVSGGNLDHQSSVSTSDEVGMVARTFNRMTQLLKIAHKQELERSAMEHELDIAHQIQANLLPKKKPIIPGYDIDSFYRPSKEVGGDYFDFLEIGERYLGLVVADVSGKGVPASIVMSMVRTLIRVEAERSKNLSTLDTLIRVNTILAKDIKKGMFVTALYAILDRQTHELLVSSAGHNPLIVWHAQTKTVELVNPDGMALGFISGEVFQARTKEKKFKLEPGDRIVLVTDGVVEAMNAQNEVFGDKRLNAIVLKAATKTSSEFVAITAQILDQYKGDAPQHDDITIVTARRLQ